MSFASLLQYRTSQQHASDGLIEDFFASLMHTAVGSKEIRLFEVTGGRVNDKNDVVLKNIY